jgi:hypothetical protein
MVAKPCASSVEGAALAGEIRAGRLRPPHANEGQPRSRFHGEAASSCVLPGLQAALIAEPERPSIPAVGCGSRPPCARTPHYLDAPYPLTLALSSCDARKRVPMTANP